MVPTSSNNDTNRAIVTRFAPSPTGTLHTGGARTALINYIYAQQQGGKYFLRIDDTDRERSTKEYEEDIVNNLHWLGIVEAEKFYQSQRIERHRFYLQKLLAEDKAYISQEEQTDPTKSPEVIRFRNPNKKVTFQDAIRGEVSFDTTDLGDFIIAKNIDTPLYHFASVVDDFELGVTDIIRAEEHLSNTPRQILIGEAIGAPLPRFAHLPLILAPDRSKLSKRKHADIASVSILRDKGYLPEAIVNYMAFLGWNPGTEQEILSLAELIQQFDLAKVQKGGAIFNQEKLDWYNREYLKRLPLGEFLNRAQPFLAELKKLPTYSDQQLEKLQPVLLERITTLADLEKMVTDGEIQFFFEQPNYPASLLKTPEHLPTTITLLEKISTDQFTADQVKNAVWDFATTEGRGKVLWPLRIALSGREKSPDPFTIAGILGKEETLNRLRHAATL